MIILGYTRRSVSATLSHRHIEPNEQSSEETTTTTTGFNASIDLDPLDRSSRRSIAFHSHGSILALLGPILTDFLWPKRIGNEAQKLHALRESRTSEVISFITYCLFRPFSPSFRPNCQFKWLLIAILGFF
jgi:hypothetical protein